MGLEDSEDISTGKDEEKMSVKIMTMKKRGREGRGSLNGVILEVGSRA